VSTLDAFMTTWAQARATFGEGTPAGGSQFDQSSRFHELESDVASAAPGSNWTGSASDVYAEANSRQARSLGSFGDLDKRLGAEVERSAAVVAAGRRDLEAVKQWVSDAAARLPNTPAGQRMLWPVISKGSSDIQDILTRSHGELTSIADRIRGVGSEYQALGDDEGKSGTELDEEPTPKGR
jgi:EspA/EspE family